MQQTNAFETTSSYYEDYYVKKRKLKMDTVFPFFALSNLCLDVFHLNKGEERRENCKEETVVVLQDTIEKKDGKIFQATYHSIVDEVPYDFTLDFNVKKRKIDHDTTSSSKAFKNASGETIKMTSESTEQKPAIIKTEPASGKGDHLEQLQFQSALDRSKLPESTDISDYLSKTSTENYEEAIAEEEAEAEDETEAKEEAEAETEFKADTHDILMQKCLEDYHLIKSKSKDSDSPGYSLADWKLQHDLSIRNEVLAKIKLQKTQASQLKKEQKELKAKEVLQKKEKRENDKQQKEKEKILKAQEIQAKKEQKELKAREALEKKELKAREALEKKEQKEKEALEKKRLKETLKLQKEKDALEKKRLKDIKDKEAKLKKQLALQNKLQKLELDIDIQH